MITRLLASLGLLIACAVAAYGVGYLIFHTGGYEPPPAGPIEPAPAQANDLPPVPAEPPAAATFRNGRLLVDALHRNSFRENEFSALRSRFASAGYSVELAGGFIRTDEDDRLEVLEAKLRQADAFLVLMPREVYTDAEGALVADFVRKGGKLLLIADPSRVHDINSLAERFGINFQPDYLFNQHENDFNFQNIYVREFQPEALTAGVNSIALYTAGSITSVGPGVAFTDANTESSVLPGGGGRSPIAWGNTRNVLAVNDFTFMIPPHEAARDNDRLLSNIVDYFTVSTREYELSDFPHFYGPGADAGVDIVLAQPDLLDSGMTLKNGLADANIPAAIRSALDPSRDAVFLGLHEDALQVGAYLQAAGIRVDDTLGGPFGTDLPAQGAALTVLDANPHRHVLIILADTSATLTKAVDGLVDGDFREDLVGNHAAISVFQTTSRK